VVASCWASPLMVFPWPCAQEIAFAAVVSAWFPAATAPDESVPGGTEALEGGQVVLDSGQVVLDGLDAPGLEV
jgi:hypothetical protein